VRGNGEQVEGAGVKRVVLSASVAFAVAPVAGMIMKFTPVDPIRALTGPQYQRRGRRAGDGVMMWPAAAPKAMGDFVNGLGQGLRMDGNGGHC
jgi:hypothetical protein